MTVNRVLEAPYPSGYFLQGTRQERRVFFDFSFSHSPGSLPAYPRFAGARALCLTFYVAYFLQAKKLSA